MLSIGVNTRLAQAYFSPNSRTIWNPYSYVKNHCLVICGDFKIHADCKDDVDSVAFCDLLLSVGLRQHVNQFTHISRHILDLIVTRFSDSIIKNEPHVDSFISDHACVNCDFHSPKPIAPIRRITYRKLKSLQSDAFKSDLLATELCTKILDACQ